MLDLPRPKLLRHGFQILTFKPFEPMIGAKIFTNMMVLDSCIVIAQVISNRPQDDIGFRDWVKGSYMAYPHTSLYNPSYISQ